MKIREVIARILFGLQVGFDRDLEFTKNEVDMEVPEIQIKTFEDIMCEWQDCRIIN